MDALNNGLECRCFYLRDAPSIVLTSFISQKTVSHLDLQLSQRAVATSNAFRSLVDRRFCGTEENLRNHLVPERRLLYTLHLDLPIGTEYSHLRNGLMVSNLTSNVRSQSLLVAIKIYPRFYETMLSRRIAAAFELAKCKFKFLKWMIDFRRLRYLHIPSDVQLLCAKVLYRECADSKLTVEFLAFFLQLTLYKSEEEVKALEYLLYHAKRCDFDIRRTDPNFSLTDGCILDLNYRILQSVLKYEVTAFYTETCYSFYKNIVLFSRGNLTRQDTIRLEKRMSKPRLFRMLQFLFIYDRHILRHDAHGSTYEALGLIWSSIPDSFVSFKELNDACEGLLDSEFLRQAHSFYEEAIGQTVSCREPRSLSHYCRCAVRKYLNHRKQWLPDAIQQLRLPTRLETYLNL